jgi:hypothetical protein
MHSPNKTGNRAHGREGAVRSAKTAPFQKSRKNQRKSIYRECLRLTIVFALETRK